MNNLSIIHVSAAANATTLIGRRCRVVGFVMRNSGAAGAEDAFVLRDGGASGAIKLKIPLAVNTDHEWHPNSGSILFETDVYVCATASVIGAVYYN